MKHTLIPERLIEKFSEFLAEMMGLHFPPAAAKELLNKLQPVSKAFGFQELPECLEWLMKAPLTKEQIAVLAYHLTIGETYFFRDQRAFTLLKSKILPQIIHTHRADKCLRIWSAACCTGEEAYSIAILLHGLLPKIKEWNIQILGTDINHAFLHKAEFGQYKPWSFRATSKEIQELYFLKKDGIFTIIPQIKHLVKFGYLNLVDDLKSHNNHDTHKSCDTSNMDLILCNNVLIYFSKKHIQKTVCQLSESLTEKGILMVTPIECPFVKDQKLRQINIDGFTFFQRVTENDLQEEEACSYSPEIHSNQLQMPLNDQPLLNVVLPEILKQDQAYLKFSIEGPITFIDPKEPSSASKLTPSDKSDSNLTPLSNTEIIEQIRTYANLGEFEKAKNKCEKALTVNKIDPQLHFLYATILESTNNLDQAIQALKRVIFLDDTFVIAHFVLGMITRKQGKYGESNRHLRNALKLLQGRPQEAIVPETEDMTVGDLIAVINTVTSKAIT